MGSRQWCSTINVGNIHVKKCWNLARNRTRLRLGWCRRPEIEISTGQFEIRSSVQKCYSDLQIPSPVGGGERMPRKEGVIQSRVTEGMFFLDDLGSVKLKYGKTCHRRSATTTITPEGSVVAAAPPLLCRLGACNSCDDRAPPRPLSQWSADRPRFRWLNPPRGLSRTYILSPLGRK